MEAIIYGGRGSGKTSALIKISKATGLYIMCASREGVEIVARQARDMGIEIPYPIFLGELRRGQRKIGKVLVDDLDAVLEGALGMEVELATTSVKVLDAECLKGNEGE